jgi:hypothetical protein
MLNIDSFLGKFAYRIRDGDRFRLCMLWDERIGPNCGHIDIHKLNISCQDAAHTKDYDLKDKSVS